MTPDTGSAPGLATIGATPYAAWSDSASPSRIHVASNSGTTWTPVLGSFTADAGRNAAAPSIAGVAGTPWVAFVQATATRTEVRVAKQGALAWDLQGGALNTSAGESATSPEIAGVSGVPYVAFLEFDGVATNRVRVARWTGAAWQAVGGDLNIGAFTAQSVAIADVGGVPHVSWSESTGSNDVQRVKRWDGSAWVAVGGAIIHDTTNGQSTASVLATDGTAPLVAWIEGTTAGANVDLRVARFSGGAWTELGTAPVDTQPAATASTARPSLVVSGGVPTAGWVTFGGVEELRAFNWNGRVWTRVGGALNRDAGDGAGQSRLVDVGGKPFASWAEIQGGGSELAAARLVAGSQLQLSTATASVVESLGTVSLTVQRVGGSAGSVAVNYDTANGTATAGSDYTASSGTFTFADGETTKTLAIPVVAGDGAEGPETFTVTLSGPGGDGELGAPTTATVTIVDDEIDTHISGGPEGPTNDTTPTWSFTADPSAGATFECAVDGQPFATCGSPFNAAALPDGLHRFSVRALTPGGAPDVTPATRDVTVDTVAPTSTGGASGTRLADGRFSGRVALARAATDDRTGVSELRCVLDPPAPPASIDDIVVGSCPLVADAPGNHTFWVASRDNAGNAEAPHLVASFAIVGAPDTAIISGPSGKTWDTTPTFTFTSTVPGSTFQCRLDGGPLVPCASPYTPPAIDGRGAHFFQVAAVGPEGVVDPTPARRDFTIDSAETHTYRCSVRPFRGLARTAFNGCTVEPAARTCSNIYATCVAATPPCPVGARCTLTTRVSWTDADGDGTSWTSFSAISFATPTPRQTRSDIPLASSLCQASGKDNLCVSTKTVTVIGDGRAPSVICEGIGAVSGSSPESGPDASRSIDCSLTMVIEAAASLDGAAQGESYSVYATGPGTVTAAPSRSSGRSLARAAAKKKPKPKPLFTTAKKTAKGPGPVTFKLALSKAGRATLKKKRKLGLTIRLTFKPKSGKTVTKTAKVTLTQRPSTTDTLRDACRKDKLFAKTKQCKKALGSKG